MKNKLFYIAVMALTVAVFIGCSSDNDKKDGGDMSGDGMMPDSSMMMPAFVLEHGTIAEGNGMGSQLKINSKKDSGTDEVILLIEEKTPTIDVTAGASTKKAEIKEGADIYAWVSPAYTASLPPQTAAQTIFVNVQDESDIPAYVEIAAVETGDMGLTVTDTAGMKWKIESNAPIAMHASKDALDTSALKEGGKALFWKDKMGMEGDEQKAVKVLVIEG